MKDMKAIDTVGDTRTREPRGVRQDPDKLREEAQGYCEEEELQCCLQIQAYM